MTSSSGARRCDSRRRCAIRTRFNCGFLDYGLSSKGRIPEDCVASGPASPLAGLRAGGSRMGRINSSRLRRCRSGAVCLLLIAVGCPQETAVWIENGSTLERLVFRVADKRDSDKIVEIGVLRVNSCSLPDSGAGSWVIGGRSGTVPVQRIVYGEPPPGFASYMGPDPLAPGCYRVSISGSGRTTFLVDSGGGVRDLGRTP